MKKFIKISIVLIAFLCNQHYIFSQNLVPNPSFELLIPATNGVHESNITRATPWFTPTTGSPDLYSNSNSLPWSIPSNLYGFKNPIEGNNYAGLGIDLLYNSSSQYFEYLSVGLEKPLIKNKKYCVSFFISCASFCCGWTLKNLGFHLSKENPTILPRINGSFLNVVPTWFENEYFNSDLEWQQISNEIIVEDEYDYLTIGFFNQYPLVDTLHTSNFTPGSPCYYILNYFYIDMVSIECCDPNGCDKISTGENINSQKLTVFPNPASQQVNLTFSEPFNKALSYTINDLQGRQLLQGSIQNQETVLDVSSLSKGIYLLNISDAEGNKWNKKIVKGE